MIRASWANLKVQVSQSINQSDFWFHVRSTQQKEYFWIRACSVSRPAETLSQFQVTKSIILDLNLKLIVPTPETTDLSSGFWPCFIFSLSIIGLILVAGFLIFVIWKWETPTVRKAGHLFLILMLAGIACVFTANLLWSVQVSKFICTIKGILIYLGITLCCGYII